MFGVKIGAVAKALVKGPVIGKSPAGSKSGMQYLGTSGKPATAGGKKAK